MLQNYGKVFEGIIFNKLPFVLPNLPWQMELLMLPLDQQGGSLSNYMVISASKQLKKMGKHWKSQERKGKMQNIIPDFTNCPLKVMLRNLESLLQTLDYCDDDGEEKCLWFSWQKIIFVRQLTD